MVASRSRRSAPSKTLPRSAWMPAGPVTWTVTPSGASARSCLRRSSTRTPTLSALPASTGMTVNAAVPSSDRTSSPSACAFRAARSSRPESAVQSTIAASVVSSGSSSTSQAAAVLSAWSGSRSRASASLPASPTPPMRARANRIGTRANAQAVRRPAMIDAAFTGASSSDLRSLTNLATKQVRQNGGSRERVHRRLGADGQPDGPARGDREGRPAAPRDRAPGRPVRERPGRHGAPDARAPRPRRAGPSARRHPRGVDRPGRPAGAARARAAAAARAGPAAYAGRGHRLGPRGRAGAPAADVRRARPDGRLVHRRRARGRRALPAGCDSGVRGPGGTGSDLTAALARVERGADDAGLVAQLGGDDLGVDVEQRQELVGLLAHAAADHEEVGGEEHLEGPVVLREPLRPVLPRQVL